LNFISFNPKNKKLGELVYSIIKKMVGKLSKSMVNGLRLAKVG